MIPVVAALVGGVVDYVKHRGKMKQLKRESETRIAEAKTDARVARVQQGDTAAAELDRIAVASRGWKDELLLLITMTPVVLTFMPETRDYASQGFAALQTMPEYYWALLAVIYVDTFGMRRLLRVVLERFIAKRLG